MNYLLIVLLVLRHGEKISEFFNFFKMGRLQRFCCEPDMDEVKPFFTGLKPLGVRGPWFKKLRMTS